MGTVEIMILLDIYRTVTLVVTTVRAEPAAIGGAETRSVAYLASYSMGSGSSSSWGKAAGA